MTLDDTQIKLLRAALIEGRLSYCCDQCEHGGDGMKTPEPSIKAAMEMLGLQWSEGCADIFHQDKWSGNEHLKPAT